MALKSIFVLYIAIELKDTYILEAWSRWTIYKTYDNLLAQNFAINCRVKDLLQKIYNNNNFVSQLI